MSPLLEYQSERLNSRHFVRPCSNEHKTCKRRVLKRDWSKSLSWRTCIWFSMIKAASSFSSPATLVLKEVAIVCKSTEMKGAVYWMRALCLICSYKVSTWLYRCTSSNKLGFSFCKYPRHEAYRLPNNHSIVRNLEAHQPCWYIQMTNNQMHSPLWSQYQCWTAIALFLSHMGICNEDLHLCDIIWSRIPSQN